LVEALRDARDIGHGFIAGTRALTLQLPIDDGLESIEAETLPAILHLDVGQGEAVLQRARHLHRTVMLAYAHHGEGP
jgi:hypothetical protein